MTATLKKCVCGYSATLSRDYWDLDVLGRGAEWCVSQVKRILEVFSIFIFREGNWRNAASCSEI